MRRDLSIAFSFAVIGLYAAYSSLSISIFDGPVPGPGFFPFILGCFLLLLSTILLVDVVNSALRKRENALAGQPAANRKFFYYMGLIGLYVGGFEYLGFLLATSLFLFVVLCFLERESWRTASAVAVGFSLVSEIVFVPLLGVSLPSGAIFGGFL